MRKSPLLAVTCAVSALANEMAGFSADVFQAWLDPAMPL